MYIVWWQTLLCIDDATRCVFDAENVFCTRHDGSRKNKKTRNNIKTNRIRTCKEKRIEKRSILIVLIHCIFVISRGGDN